MAYLPAVTPIEAYFVASPLGFDRLHHDVIFCSEAILLKVIKEIATTNSTCPYYSLNNISSLLQLLQNIANWLATVIKYVTGFVKRLLYAQYKYLEIRF